MVGLVVDYCTKGDERQAGLGKTVVRQIRYGPGLVRYVGNEDRGRTCGQ